jgi:hypothetical protein
LQPLAFQYCLLQQHLPAVLLIFPKEYFLRVLRENDYPDAGKPYAFGMPSQRTSHGILCPFDTLMFQDSYTDRLLPGLSGTPAGFGHPLGVQDLETPRVLFHTRNVPGVPLTELFARYQSL